MFDDFDYWRLLAGLALFLFGMFELETALRKLAGRPFKRFMRAHTTPPIKGVLTGALSTAALQSSSVVSLMVLAFVGTGVINLASAISMVIGSNLGTTATGWIVATIGFKLNIETLALPLITFGGAGVVWTRSDSRIASLSHFVIGLGLMLIGLSYMKDGVVDASALFDPQSLSQYPPIVFLATGLAIAAIIQSSSATIMIALSALYAAIIPLESAAAVAIGADLGTTVTALLGAIAGSEAKKRVALAIIIFNVIVDTLAFVFLHPLLQFIKSILLITDPLYTLVAFHSLFNLFGIILFLPVMTPFSRFLERFFRSRRDNLVRHIRKQDIATPDLAVANIGRETGRLIDQVAALNQISFGLPIAESFYVADVDRQGVRVFEADARHEACYAEAKELEGEILAFALLVQKVPLEAAEAARLGQLIPALRHAVVSAKSVKDTHADLKMFRDSENDTFNSFAGIFGRNVAEFYGQLSTLGPANSATLVFEALVSLKQRNESLHAATHTEIYRHIHSDALSRFQISTLLNVSREIYVSNQSLLQALAELLLDMTTADTYASLPVAG